MHLANAWLTILTDFRNALSLGLMQRGDSGANLSSVVAGGRGAGGSGHDAKEKVAAECVVAASMTARCLRVVARYVSWIDIQIIANDRFVPLLFDLLNRSSACMSAATEVIGAVSIQHRKSDAASR